MTIAFYLFAFMACCSGFLVITARNPVHAVLFLILAFFNAAGLFILLQAEFLAMLLVVVYVGAVAVLFLFVVMMLDINYAELREGFQKYRGLGLLIGGLLLAELCVSFFSLHNTPSPPRAPIDPTDDHNTLALGKIIYTDYIYLFQLAGLILLVAMIGAITLTHRHRGQARRQSIAQQNRRQRDDVVKLVTPPSGQAPSEQDPSRPASSREPASRQNSEQESKK